MKILLLSIGKPNDKIYAAAIEAFTQRLQKYYTTTWRFVHLKNNETINIEDIKKEEAQLILPVLLKDDYEVLLDENGKMLTSPQLANCIQQRANESFKQIVFIIGGAYGVHKTVIDRAQYTWSLSTLVFPHQLVRLILAEQLYRACTILRNEKYHHT